MQSLWWITPGMHVSVVNSYDAASDFVVVNVERIVDLPTDGKPMSATRASPTFSTSKPSPAPPPAFGVSSSAVRSFASRARSEQRCDIVALFTCVRAISFSMSRIFSTVVMVAAQFLGALPTLRVGLHGCRRSRPARAGRTAPGTACNRGMVSLSALLVLATLWHARLA